jgi:two-component system, OmpR family, sensor histidine kinase VanS
LTGKSLKSNAYSKLLRRLFIQTFAVLAAAVIMVIVLRTALKGRLADGIVEIISRIFRTDWYGALYIYDYYIRSNIYSIAVAAVVIFFFILFRLSLSWFTKYFNQIVTGVEQLSDEKEGNLSFSPELRFMEVKLNEVKDKLKQRMKEAQAAEQRKNDMVVYLAHDIRTPLTSVIGYLALLDEIPDMPAEQRLKYTHIALDKAYRLENLMNEFFEITRYNLQSIPLNRERIDLGYMLLQLSEELYPQYTAKGKKIKINVGEDIYIFGDSDKLARVFNNILKNAIAYGEEGSDIQISAEGCTDRAVIEFISKGSIPEDKLSSIFEKFYRLDAARSSGTGGSGLGLAIAKDIVELHGGSIKAENRGENSVFTVSLPVKPSAKTTL